ncbi:JmjC domain-containing protein [Streptacidiphilus fuscans]|uniref:Cupin n=1 Tax=Streptacidiphilus fuscans TaxID=2789292 RepID=A0A931FEK8_9ACTN|nr:cupin domain-containing protein [Streptacidiphilus fuscans]MBF9071882.1 cupin [Streptacidiphilus fuscans]
MDHLFVRGVEKALGWDGPAALGTAFARGTLDEPDFLARLLTPNKLLDLVMRRSLTTPQFRIFHEGSEMHPGRYINPAVTRRGQAIPMADMRRVGTLLGSGCTLVLDEIDFFDPVMEVVCRALQWWSHELVQVNAYLTTQDASGFKLHWDDHDVLIVQLAGEKSWEVRGASRRVPMYRDGAPNTEPSEDIVWQGSMRAGDVMHIPRGFWHQATRSDQGDGYSLHATFGIVKRAGVNWAAWLADQCRADEAFRADLNHWEWGGQQEHLVQALADLASAMPPAEFLAARERERSAARHVPHLGIFGEPHTVVCVSEFEPVINTIGHTVDVIASGKKLTFAAKALPALRLLLSGHPVDIATAAPDTGVDVARLAEILIKEEICTALTSELSSGYTELSTAATYSKAH